MARKMSVAKYGGKEVPLSKYEKYMKGELTCVYCDIPVTYNKKYERRYGGRNIVVPHYYKRADKEVEHKETCNFNVGVAVRKLIEDFAGQDLFDADPEAPVMRLHLITEKLRELKKVEDGDRDKTNEAGNNKELSGSELEVEKKDKIEPYLSTLRKVVKLRSELESNSDISNKLKLEFYNKKLGRMEQIRWSKFYFASDDEEYKKAYNYIEKKVYHPIVFQGIIKQVKDAKNQESYYITLNKIKYEEDKQEYQLDVQLTVLNKDAELKSKLRIGMKILVYGLFYAKSSTWEAKEKGTNEVKKKVIFKDIKTTIYNKNQIYIEKS